MLDAVRPTTSTVQQWWVLTGRAITPTLRNGELFTQVAASIMFTVGFYIPLKQLMGAFAQGMSSYAQYLMPLIALQAIAFAAVSAAFRSATDSVQGINRRFKSHADCPADTAGLTHVGQHVPLLSRAGGLAGVRSRALGSASTAAWRTPWGSASWCC